MSSSVLLPESVTQLGYPTRAFSTDTDFTRPSSSPASPRRSPGAVRVSSLSDDSIALLPFTVALPLLQQ